ncbi:MAG: hypothetical protein SNJ62_05310 [Chloracidobacterium sp.]|uniref:SPOR domain-containing protein n=1 Tax=Chloracidobacterium validum TaxID=2821543 RepID=A0ABX8B9K6_9BACT|nr:hypothetical protein [Chloracidobacterium validum]QUW02736.1 hypothetical protein J8C06_10405 [Chloracidobacterium validum]
MKLFWNQRPPRHWQLGGVVLLIAATVGFAVGGVRDETAGRTFPVRELGINQSLLLTTKLPSGVLPGEQLEVAREFGVAWLHRGRREGIAFALYRCPSYGRALGLSKLIGGERLGDTVLTVQPDAPEEKRSVVAAWLRARLEAWQATLPPVEGQDEEPVVLRKLPSPARQSGTERYAVGALGLARATWLRANALPASPGCAFAWADYTAAAPFEHVLVAEYPTPQDATAALAAAQGLASGRCQIARRGNFIVVVDGVRDAARAQAAIERVEYDYVVRWLGDPPPRLSTPTRTTQQDVRHIGQLLVSIASFVVLAGAGMVLLGTAAGGAFFYWRRQRAGDGFIAADAMLRLDLQEERTLPPARASSVKRLTD